MPSILFFMKLSPFLLNYTWKEQNKKSLRKQAAYISIHAPLVILNKISLWNIKIWQPECPEKYENHKNDICQTTASDNAGNHLPNIIPCKPSSKFSYHQLNSFQTLCERISNSDTFLSDKYPLYHINAIFSILHQ